MQLASWISPLHRLFGELRSFIAHFAWLSGPTLWPRPAKLMNPLGGSRGITPFLATSRSGQCDASHRTVSSVSGSAREGQPPDIHPRGLRSAGAAAAVCDVYNYASAGQHWRNEGCISDLSDEKVRHVGTRDGQRQSRASTKTRYAPAAGAYPRQHLLNHQRTSPILCLARWHALQVYGSKPTRGRVMGKLKW